MRANIVGLLCSMTSINASMAVCHSGKPVSFGKVCDVITGVAQGGPVLARKVAGSDPRNEERMRQAVCSVIAASVERLGRSVPEMDQDTVAIEFDLVNPASDGLHLLDRGRQCSWMNPGKGALS